MNVSNLLTFIFTHFSVTNILEYAHVIITLLTDPELIFSIDKPSMRQNLTESEKVFFTGLAHCKGVSHINHIISGNPPQLKGFITIGFKGVDIIIVPQLNKYLKFKSFQEDKSDCTLNNPLKYLKI